MKSVDISLQYFECEKGSITLVIPMPDGGHTYQVIDNKILVAAFKKASKVIPGQIASLQISITDTSC